MAIRAYKRNILFESFTDILWLGPEEVGELLSGRLLRLLLLLVALALDPTLLVLLLLVTLYTEEDEPRIFVFLC